MDLNVTYVYILINESIKLALQYELVLVFNYTLFKNNLETRENDPTHEL